MKYTVYIGDYTVVQQEYAVLKIHHGVVFV